MDVNFSDRYNPFSYRGTAHVDFHKSPIRYKLIGGAMGGSKSVSGCAEGIQLSLDVPGNRGAIVRKNRTVLQRTTMVTFFQICPPELIRNFNKSTLEVTMLNGSVIIFIEADESKDPLFEKLKSLELGWYFIDEASEVVRNAHVILSSRLRWPAAQGHYYGILASNPEQCWIQEDFPVGAQSKPRPNHAYFPFLPRDNPFLPQDYIPELESIFDINQQRKYIDGDWSVTDDPLQIIPYTNLKNKLATAEDIRKASGVHSLGVDVAEFGDDKTIIAHMVGSIGTKVDELKKKRTDQVAAFVSTTITDNIINANKVGIDAIGVGAGVWGNLVGDGKRVQRIIAGAKPVVIRTGRDERWRKKLNQPFFNLKSQMWWKTRLDVMDQDSDFLVLNHPILIQDLTAPRYHIASEKKIVMEEKDETKIRIGRSPDYGDAMVTANWVREIDMTSEFKVLFEA